MDTFIAIAVGLGLAAATGFRIFVPLFIASLAANTGHLVAAPGFEWLGTPVTMIAFGTATLLEVGAYYIPWVDNALDAVTTPAAVIAGMVASASVLVDVPPLLKWAVVLIGGGGIAGLVQGATVALRAKSGLFTGGLANVVVASVELVGATATTILALVVPLVALALVVVLLVVAYRSLRRLTRPARGAQ